MPDKNPAPCKCPYSCSRHGDCQACMEYHRKSGSKTNCGRGGKDSEGGQKQA